jgi:hypothetical protein
MIPIARRHLGHMKLRARRRWFRSIMLAALVAVTFSAPSLSGTIVHRVCRPHTDGQTALATLDDADDGDIATRLVLAPDLSIEGHVLTLSAPRQGLHPSSCARREVPLNPVPVRHLRIASQDDSSVCCV